MSPSRGSSFWNCCCQWFSKGGREQHSGDNGTNRTPLHEDLSSSSSDDHHHRHHLAADETMTMNREPMTMSKATTIAACFLMDYEFGRAPTLSSNLESITDVQLELYKLKFSSWWYWLGLKLATFLFFVQIFENKAATVVLYLYPVGIFVYDLYMVNQFSDSAEYFWDQRFWRESYIFPAFLTFLAAFTIQLFFWLVLGLPNQYLSTMVSSLFKPLIFFYMSRRARDALKAILRIGRILFRVMIIELFLILTFAAIACRIYNDDDNFRNLWNSWLSLFELSTTVVNPAIWMPMYAASKANAIFFIIFIILCTFYLHSVILSVVFQVFIQSAAQVHERTVADLEESIQLAFKTLATEQSFAVGSNNNNASSPSPSSPLMEVETRWIRDAVRKIRPHYNKRKINVLMEILDPSNRGSLDYDSFRMRIRDALNVSIRSTRHQSCLTAAIETLSLVVTVVNFLFVIILTSEVESKWFDEVMVILGSVITGFGLLELAMRCNFMKITYYSMTRLKTIFDIMALLGAIISVAGICLYLTGWEEIGIEYLLTGRAIDMVRTMRFFPMFRDVVERSVNVFPALAGPIYLVLTTIHVFVYVGMVLWGGYLDTDLLATNENIENYYYLNNFNSYMEGLITVFNIIVINDWHEIAKVFLYADRYNSKYIVYPFFILIVVIAVCILLNVITAFFVETFVRKLGKVDVESTDVTVHQNFQTKKSASSKRKEVAWQQMALSHAHEMHHRRSNSTAGSSEGEMEYDIFEREEFGQIVESVASVSKSHIDSSARHLRDTLELVGTFSPDCESVGFMICGELGAARFTTSHFLQITECFLSPYDLGATLADMSGQLYTPATGDTRRVICRQFLHPQFPSQTMEITAHLLPQQQNIALFVSRTKHHNFVTESYSAMS